MKTLFSKISNKFAEKLAQPRKLNSAFVIPSTLVNQHGITYSGGVYDSAGSYIVASESRTSNNRFLGELKSAGNFESVEPVEGNSLYLGLCHRHYGHFLIETVARLSWITPSELQKYQNIIVLTEERRIPQFAKDFFDLIDVAERVLYIEHPIVCKQLTVLPQAVIYPNTVSKHIAKVSAFINLQKLPSLSESSSTVYLSRSQLKAGQQRMVIGEKLIEQALLNNGVEVVSPEHLSLSEQVALFTSTTNLIGATGSAFHTLLLSGGNKNIMYFGSRKLPAVFKKIDKTLGNRADFIDTKFKYLSGLAEGYDYGFKPEMFDPRPVLQKLIDRQWITASDFELNDDALQTMVREYNSALLLRALFVESQFKTDEECLELKNRFLERYKVNRELIVKSTTETPVFKRFFNFN